MSYSIGSEVSDLEEEKSEVGRVWGEGAGMGGIRGWERGGVGGDIREVASDDAVSAVSPAIVIDCMQ